jgi:hypothetical protein
VENYDPKSQRRAFTEPLTLQALANLRIRQRDLYFPVAEDLAPIAGDKLFYKDRLVERSLKLAEAVRAERARLLREAAEPPPAPEPSLHCSQRPFTAKCRGLPPEERPTPAVLRAREIEEQILEEKRQLVLERERRHERSRQLLELERQRGIEMQKEANLERKERSQLFNERVRQQQIQRIWDYEAGVVGRRSRMEGVHPEGGLMPKMRKGIGSKFGTKSDIFSPMTFPEGG